MREGLPGTASRAGHNMVINETQAKFYVIGGSRAKVEINDFIEYDILTEVTHPIQIFGHPKYPFSRV